MDIDRSRLTAHYHLLCNSLGMSEDVRRNMLFSNYGVHSSSELSDEDLQMLVGRLVAVESKHRQERMQASGASDADVNLWRKRVIACLCAYLQARGYKADVKAAIAVAERAGGKVFAELSQKELAKVYNTFKGELGRITRSNR